MDIHTFKYQNGIIRFLFIAVVCALCLSCRVIDPFENEERPDEALYSELALIKITPEMQTRIFVAPVVDSIVKPRYWREYLGDGKWNTGEMWHGDSLYYSDSLALCNTQFYPDPVIAFAQEQLAIIGTNPYILLDNGYALIDWRWSYFHPLAGDFIQARYFQPLAGSEYCTNPYYYNGSLANEQYYLLRTSWSELQDLKTVWQMNEGTLIATPEIRYIRLKSIEEYDKSNPVWKGKSISRRHSSAFNAQRLYEKDAEQGLTYVQDCNELQEAFVEVINEIIRNKKFEQLTRRR